MAQEQWSDYEKLVLYRLTTLESMCQEQHSRFEELRLELSLMQERNKERARVFAFLLTLTTLTISLLPYFIGK
jgi:hypothetical protein